MRNHNGKFLSEPDLARARAVYFRARFCDTGNPSVTLEEARAAYLADCELERELRIDYDLPDDENYHFSMVDGAIYETEDPG